LSVQPLPDGAHGLRRRSGLRLRLVVRRAEGLHRAVLGDDGRLQYEHRNSGRMLEVLSALHRDDAIHDPRGGAVPVLTDERLRDLTMGLVARKKSPFPSSALAAWALGAALAVLGCEQPRSDWNKVFQRSQGWLYADGGSSVELAGGRRVWFFG